MALDANGTAVTGRSRDARLRSPRDVRRLEPGRAPARAIGRQAALRRRKACFVPGTPVQAERSAGAANGSFALDACLAEGVAAGAEAARLAGFGAADRVVDADRRRRRRRSRSSPLWVVPSPRGIERGPKQFVDLQNDVAASDIVLAAREGYHSIEHVKRYTALGFGTDQGKLGNINGMAILAQALGNDIPSTGTTTFRPNYTPVTFGAIAGPRSRRSVRARCARPRCTRGTRSTARCSRTSASGSGRGTSRRPGEDLHAAVARECLAARNGVGIMDASTLGKIDIQGPDAATFLDWVYTNAWAQARRRPLPLRPDARRERHGDGRRRHHAPRRASFPDDHHHRRRGARDGVARALAADRMAAPRGLPHVGDRSLGDRRAWPGPTAARWCEAVCEGIDFSPRGVSVHVVPRGHRRRRAGARDADQLLRRARLRGQRLRQRGAARVGSADGRRREVRHHAVRHRDDARAARREGLHHRRPGHRRLGDARRSRHGLDRRQGQGLPRPALARARGHRARRSQASRRPADRRPDRPSCRKAGRSSPTRGARPPVPMLGHVTSSYFSACLERSIALALVQNGRNRMGEKVHVSAAGRARDHAPSSPSPCSSIPKGRGRMSDPILRESPLARFGLAARATRCPRRRRRHRARARLPRATSICAAIAQDPRFVGAVERRAGRRAADRRRTRVTDVQGITMYWLGPDEWLIVTPDERRAAIERELRQALAALRVAITDVSGGQTVAAAARPRTCATCWRRAAPSTCIRARSRIGQCAQSHLAKAPILIGQIEDQPYFELIVRRSFADYLWTWLEGAAAEYGLEVRAREAADAGAEGARRTRATGHRALRSRLHAARRRRHLRVDPLPDRAGRARRASYEARARAVLRRLRARARSTSAISCTSISARWRAIRARRWRRGASSISAQADRADHPAQGARAHRLARGARPPDGDRHRGQQLHHRAHRADVSASQHLLASDPEIVDGEFTGRIEGIPCFHEGKIIRLEAWLASRGQALPDFAESYFYGDSQSDVPLMEKVTHPVVVEPDEALARLAQARNWPVISLR